MKKKIDLPIPKMQAIESPWFAGIVAVVYALFAMQAGPIWQSSPFTYFNYLADAFLHGQFRLRLIPPQTHDLALYNGNYFLYWPPFSAILLIPIVALFGVHFSDILFTLLLAALNVGLVAKFLHQLSDRGIASTGSWYRILLTTFFAFGTVHFVLARSEGTVISESMFLLSPVFFTAFLGISKKQIRFSNLLLGITSIATLMPILLNIGTGWVTFGPRYTLDFYPPLLI